MEAQTIELETLELTVRHGVSPGLDLLIVLARRRKMLLGATLSAALFAGVVSVLIPNRYTATASIVPPQQNPSLAASMLGQLGSLDPIATIAQKDLGLKSPNDIYVGMLKSRTVQDALIRRFDLLNVYRERRMSDARRELENATSILLGKEGFITISVEDKDSRRAAEMANTYVEELGKVTQQLAVTEASQRRLFFGQQLEQAKNDLAAAEQALKETELKTGLIQLDSQAKAIIESVVKLRAAIATKEVELHAMRSFSTDQNPDVILAEQELSGLRSQLALLGTQSGGEGDIQVPAAKVPEASLEYVRKLREVKYHETIFELLAKQYEAAKLDESKAGAVVQVLDPGVEPDKRSSPRRALIIIVTTLVAFVGSVGYAFAAETLYRMRLDPDFNARLTTLQDLILKTPR
jgi:uncharacterized protein involved in exopolysaccharide biosynthesis